MEISRSEVIPNARNDYRGQNYHKIHPPVIEQSRLRNRADRRTGEESVIHSVQEKRRHPHDRLCHTSGRYKVSYRIYHSDDEIRDIRDKRDKDSAQRHSLQLAYIG